VLRFPYLVAWEKILGEPHRWNNQDLEDLELLFSDRSGLAHFHFSELHRACLGLSGKTLQDVVLYTGKSGIDVIDNTGRTTLSWAARRGDDVAVKLLLERGANPSRPDQSMKTPLHWSIGGECILLLLQYDAEVYAKDDDGRTALNYVASNRDDATFVDTLVKFNADIESEDNEGWRPLHWAAHKNQPATLDRLLYHGADKNATDKLGRSPLHLAILRNCHEVLKILVEVVANGERSKTALGSTVLHCAADHADIQTLHILRSANLSNVKIEEENKDGFTAQKIAEFRRDCNEEWAYSSCQASDPDPKEWYIAFRTFIAGVHPIERVGDGK